MGYPGMGVGKKYKNSGSHSAEFPSFSKMWEILLLLSQGLGVPKSIPLHAPLLPYTDLPFSLCFCLIFPP